MERAQEARCPKGLRVVGQGADETQGQEQMTPVAAAKFSVSPRAASLGGVNRFCAVVFTHRISFSENARRIMLSRAFSNGSVARLMLSTILTMTVTVPAVAAAASTPTAAMTAYYEAA